MKRFLPSKRVLQVTSVTALAVLFLIIINILLSNRSIIENLFSTKGIFVGTFDVNSTSNETVVEKNTEYSASLNTKISSQKKSLVKPTTKVISVVSSTELLVSPIDNGVPKLYISEIQAGDEVSALNEFVRICNYGKDLTLNNIFLKKKSSTGKEEGLITTTWKDEKILFGNCIYVANAEADIQKETIARWAKSHALAEKNNTLLLYYNDTLVDEVFWNVIPKGESIIRESATSTWKIKNN
jgi:hypothetical protein